TATSTDGQMNPPLLPERLFSVWAKDPTADCRTIFNAATRQMEADYTAQQIAVAEIPQLFDGTAIRVYPFEENTESMASWSLKEGGLAGPGSDPFSPEATASSQLEPNPSSLGTLDFSEFDQLLLQDEQANMQAATPETLQRIEEARKQAPAYAGFPAFFIQLDHRFTVNTDGASALEERSKIYLLNNVAAEDYGTIVLKDDPPNQILDIQTARIIYPDGKFLDLETKTSRTKNQDSRYHQIRVPGARQGCLIELASTLNQPPRSTLSIINHELPLQQSIPISSARITLESPRTLNVFHKLYGQSASPEEFTGEYSQKTVFDLGAIPALEPLPYDPPLNDFSIRMTLSSLASWEAFREWADRLMRGSDVLNKETEDLAATLTRFAKTDTEKVKALYEFLCELHYETTPVGARAFRPRLPEEVCSSRYGDCKDKANALVSMARSAGVTGYMALVNRSSTTDETFPSWQFNHAVAYFPSLSEFPGGLWCDATDGSTPFASLPPGDIGRNALVLKKDEAVFMPIQLANLSINSLEQDWVMALDSSGAVKGTIEFTAHGLSDYCLRQKLKRSSPLQAQYVVQHLISQQTTGLSIEEVSISDLTNLSTPLHITAHCTGSSWALIQASLNAPYDIWPAISLPRRERDVVLNDGQPLTITQHIQVNGDGASPSAMKWKKKTESALTEVAYASTPKGWERRTKIELIDSHISPEAYPEFQTQIAEWNLAMKHHLNH
ncbi:MAG: DUF3857 domain-containing protein, partial [Kiritimatiellales bacterium]|nr:DUF3857 domain-containing protein [Kiritimatiellales bacterium]